jgi:hypothetical protein
MNAAIDAVLCLLLISAAVVGLVGVDSPSTEDPGRADAVAATLATTTAQVNYSLAPGLEAVRDSGRTPGNRSSAARSDSRTGAADSPELDRTAHGSLGGLLARAATANSGLAGSGITDANGTSAVSERTPLTRTRIDFRRAVRDAVRARTGARIRIDAIWRPYPGAPIGGRATVGPEPPSTGVHAATLTVPTRADPISESATTDFDALGAAVADRTVAVLVPPGPARITLRGDDPTAALVRHRYDRLAAVTNTSLSTPLATEDTDAANARLADALAPRMAADLRNRYDGPTAAAENVSVSSVRIVVQTWDAGEEAR